MLRSLLRYHPRIGHTFIPGIKSRVPHESGGYLIKVNEQGFRSNYNFADKKDSRQFRILLFGDSQTAGDGVSNGERYGDFLEELIPNLRAYNFGIPGTGTDQQYLAYQEYAQSIEHDLLVISVYVENIGRVAGRYRPFSDEKGEIVLYAKPYYELHNGRLILRGVPVPREPLYPSALKREDARHVHWGVPYPKLRQFAKKLGLRDFLQRIVHFQPVPEYNHARNPKWILLRAILEEWIKASKAPVLLVPVPVHTFIEETSDPTAYLKRFEELAEDMGCHYHDPLANFKKHPKQVRRRFRFTVDNHLTPEGHRTLAESLSPVIKQVLGIQT